MNYKELDTPSLIVDRKQMVKNLKRMQEYADAHHVGLRPHTKTHKTPALALLQKEYGCSGITVAKVGEAEVMAAAGLTDIFIANEIIGEEKYKRIQKLAETVNISFGLDSIAQAEMVDKAFSNCDKPAQCVIEIEVGERRSGVVEEEECRKLLNFLKTCKHIYLKGVFSHDGDSYSAPDIETARRKSVIAQQRTLKFADMARAAGFDITVVSIGSTPSLANESEILDGITEIRPGTYIFMDASQTNATDHTWSCAAFVLATVMSLPTPERVILDVGAKGLTMQSRNEGICAVKGLGDLIDYPGTHIAQMYDEHAIIYNKEFHDAVKVGDVVRIAPVHICPVVNLYDELYLIDENGNIEKSLPVLCRGKLR